MASNKQFNIKNGLTVGISKKLVVDQLGAVSATDLKVDDYVISNLTPVDDLTLNLGAHDKRWNTIYTQDVSASGDVTWSGGGSISANSVYTTVSTNSAEWFHVGATGTYDDFTGGFNYEKIVYVHDTQYTFPTTPRGHDVFHLFPDYDRPRIVALKSESGLNKDQHYKIHRIDTSNNNVQVFDLDDNFITFIELYKRGENKVWEVLSATVYIHDVTFELPTTAKNHSALHVFDESDRPRVVALQTSDNLTLDQHYYIDRVDPANGNVRMQQLDGTVIGWVESINKRGNPLVWEVITEHDVNEDSDYYNIGEAVRHNMDTHDHDVSTTVKTYSASWEERTPVIHSMTRSILQVITPYGSTGELVDWTPAYAQTPVSGWWDASDESTITTHDGTHDGNITTWTDRSDSIVSTAQNTPVTSSTLQNGLSTIDLQSDELFKIPNYKMPTSGNVQIFIVCDASDIDNQFDSIISYQSDKDFQLQSGAGGSFKGVLNTIGVGNANYVPTDMPSNPTTGMAMFCITFSYKHKIFNLRINTAKQGTDLEYKNKLSPSGELKIFSNRAGDQHPGGKVAEVVITEDISTANRVLIEGYLTHKWGLTSTLQSVHPYKNTPPLYGLNTLSPKVRVTS